MQGWNNKALQETKAVKLWVTIFLFAVFSCCTSVRSVWYINLIYYTAFCWCSQEIYNNFVLNLSIQSRIPYIMQNIGIKNPLLMYIYTKRGNFYCFFKLQRYKQNSLLEGFVSYFTHIFLKNFLSAIEKITYFCKLNKNVNFKRR